MGRHHPTKPAQARTVSPGDDWRWGHPRGRYRVAGRAPPPPLGGDDPRLATDDRKRGAQHPGSPPARTVRRVQGRDARVPQVWQVATAGWLRRPVGLGGPNTSELQVCHRTVDPRTPDIPSSTTAFRADRPEAPESFVERHPGATPAKGGVSELQPGEVGRWWTGGVEPPPTTGTQRGFPADRPHGGVSRVRLRRAGEGRRAPVRLKGAPHAACRVGPWTGGDSNPGPLPCEGSALPAELPAPGGPQSTRGPHAPSPLPT